MTIFYFSLQINRVLNLTARVVFNSSLLIVTAVLSCEMQLVFQKWMVCIHYLGTWNFLVAFNCHINCWSWSWEAPCKTRLLAANWLFLQFESAWFCSVNEWATWLNYIALHVPSVVRDCHFYVHAYLSKFWIIWEVYRLLKTSGKHVLSMSYFLACLG